MPEAHDVVVVGAGPVGLSLALGLARRGRDVLVLESNRTTAEHSRAPAIWPGAQEVLADLGVIDRFEANGLVVPAPEMWDADHDRPILRIPIEELAEETRFPRLLIVPQSRTERLLSRTLGGTSTGCVRWGAEVTGLTRDKDGVEVRYRRESREARVRARFVVGADGAHSTVRESIGGTLDGITYRARAALADITSSNIGNLPFPRLTTRPRPGIAIRIDAHLWRLILPFSGDDDPPPLDQRIRDAVGGLFPPIEYETAWKSDFTLHRRMSSRWIDRRVALAGDAAHLNSPVGGQGMNAGIADAAVLAPALDEALANDDPDRLAAAVRGREQAVGRGVNTFTDRLTRVLLAGNGRFIRPAMWSAGLLLAVPGLRRRILRRVAMLDAR